MAWIQRAAGPSPGDEDPLRLLVDGIVDYGILTLDVDGVVTSSNTGARRLDGYDADQIVGRHFSVFYAEDDVAAGKPEHDLAVAVAQGRFEDEGWRIRRDGSRFWANVVITPLRGPDGRLRGFGEVTRDFTDRKRGEDALRASEQRFRLLVGAVSDYAIYMLDVDGRVVSWNLGAEQLKGYSADEVVGRHYSMFFVDEDRRAGRPERQLDLAVRQGRAEDEAWRVRRDGTRFWANAVVTALRGPDGDLVGFGKVTRDLTQRKLAEDASRGVLEREREAAARMRELDESRRELVSIVAHDVRAPINVLGGLVDLLRSEWADFAPHERDDLLRRISDRVRSVTELVDDVLDVVRLESGALEIDPRPLDLATVVRRAVDDLGDEADRVVFEVPEHPAPALGDERRVWQVVVNLVTNALKYSGRDTEVEVAVVPVGREVLVEVRDRGVGVPPERHREVFDRYSRTPSPDGRLQGAGLGLYISRRLVEALGGRIWVGDRSGGGAVFTFSLPGVPAAP